MKAIFIFFFLCGYCYSGTIDPSSLDKDHIEYGKKFHYVLQLKGKCSCEKDNKDHEFNASAVAISPYYALTAAHVVEGIDSAYILMNKNKIETSKIIIHENFVNNRVGYSDIAICKFKNDLGLDFYPSLYEKNDEISKVVSISGYGNTGTFMTGAVKFDNKKRAGSNIISKTERDVIICSSIDRRTQLEFIISSGDSGGGLFIGNRLAGINSFVIAQDGDANSDYGDECAHTRISKFTLWIKEKINQELE